MTEADPDAPLLLERLKVVGGRERRGVAAVGERVEDDVAARPHRDQRADVLDR